MNYLASLRAVRKQKRKTLALHYGDSLNALAYVVPDDEWPDMFRNAWPDGSLSDMTNLSRAKDAAQAIAERGPPARNRQRFHWQQNRSNSGSEPRPCVEGRLD